MKKLDSKSVWLFFLNFVIRGLFLLVFFLFFSLIIIGGLNTPEGSPIVILKPNSLDWLVSAIPLIIIFCFLWAKLSYRFYKYEISDLGFKKESGVIYKSYVTIPYDRIQNVDIHRGILARLLGLSDLQIQTAGFSAIVTRYGAQGMGAEGRLPGLSKEIAEELRDELIRRSHNSKTQSI